MTRRVGVVYLAGPDVFRPDADSYGATLKALCEAEGLEPLWPADTQADERGPNGRAFQIFDANLAMIARARAVIANIAPFRGPHLDCGTAFEIGFAHALRKPVFAYTADLKPLAQRLWCARSPDGALHDLCGNVVENFGLIDILMVACSIEPDVADSAATAVRSCARHLRYLNIRAAERAS